MALGSRDRLHHRCALLISIWYIVVFGSRTGSLVRKPEQRIKVWFLEPSTCPDPGAAEPLTCLAPEDPVWVPISSAWFVGTRAPESTTGFWLATDARDFSSGQFAAG